MSMIYMMFWNNRTIQMAISVISHGKTGRSSCERDYCFINFLTALDSPKHSTFPSVYSISHTHRFYMFKINLHAPMLSS